jgi:hypothetical protein
LLAVTLVLAGCIGNGAIDPDASDSGTDRPGEAIAPGWPALEEAQIRPGVNVVDGSCTSNFLFRTPDNGTLFLGTAAHCVSETEIGEPVAIRGGAFQGTLAYSSFKAMEQRGDDIAGNDFALIELPDEVRSTVHPAMLTYGGPTGIAEDVAQGDKVLAHGNSTLRPGGTPDEAGPREGYVTHHGDWTTGMYFVGPGVPGDSGSAVTMADGRALGTLVTLEIAPQPASNNVANLDATLGYANQVTDREVELVTWQTTDEGTLPSLDGGEATELAVPE